MSDKLIFHCTFDRNDPERATLPFVAANVAAGAGLDAVVLCTIDGVWLGTQGGTDGVQAPGLAPLSGSTLTGACPLHDLLMDRAATLCR